MLPQGTDTSRRGPDVDPGAPAAGTGPVRSGDGIVAARLGSWVRLQSVAADTVLPPARVRSGPITVQKYKEYCVALTAEQKKEILASYGLHPTDTGSAEAQVALLSKRIADLTEHLKTHKHDHHTRRGLLGLVGKRRRLLRYLQEVDIERYRSLIERLGLRR